MWNVDTLVANWPFAFQYEKMNCAKKFPKYIVVILLFFAVCGFQPEQPIFTSHKALFAISMFQIYNIIAFLSHFPDIYAWMNEKFSKLDMTNEMVQHIIALLAYSVICIESVIKRKTQRRFWRLYEDLLQYHSIHHAEEILRNYALKFTEYFLFCSSSFAYALIATNEDYNFSYNIPYFLAYLSIMGICQIRLFYYLFYLELIKAELKAIEKEIESDIDESFELPSKWELTRKYCKSIHELCECLNSVFGWSNLLSVLAIFLFLLTDTNWVYYYRHHRNSLLTIIFALWTCHFVLCLAYTFSAANQCVVLVKVGDL